MKLKDRERERERERESVPEVSGVLSKPGCESNNSELRIS